MMMDSTPKKRKGLKKKDDRNRLSELPDEILVKILSFLPTLDAVRTVLIRRFGNLWTSIHSLSFEVVYENRFPDFASFVRNVLILHQRIPIHKFQLQLSETDFDYKPFFAEMKTWIRFAIDREVKELKLGFRHYNGYPDPDSPRCIFTSQSLVDLELVNCGIKDLSRVEMGSLRKLTLTEVEVSNEVFNKIISGSPLLQELVLESVYGLDKLCFTAPNILRLSLDITKLRLLDCPNLKILDIYIDYLNSHLEVVDLSSLNEVNIRSRKSIHQIDTLVKTLCNVKFFKYSDTRCMIEPFKLKELAFPQTRWKCLHIEARLDEELLSYVCGLLRSSPNLEELMIQKSWPSEDATHECRDLSLELDSPCLMPQLKSVSIRGFELPCQDLLCFAEFLLGSCIVLEKMVIIPSIGLTTVKEELEFVKQFNSFPRASTNARVIFG